jgi:hypothetical protein
MNQSEWKLRMEIVVQWEYCVGLSGLINIYQITVKVRLSGMLGE